MNSLQILLSRMPPCLCAAVASGRKGRLSPREISIKSGIPLRSVERLSSQVSWENVKMGVAWRFADACGVDLVRQGRTRNYMKTTLRQSSIPLPGLTPRQRAAFNNRMAKIKSGTPSPPP